MAIKSYQFFCGNCGYKRFTKGDDIKDLIEIKTSPIPRGGPTLDPAAKSKTMPSGVHLPAEIITGITTPKRQPQCKKFKCPKCGYVIKAKQLKDQEIPKEQNEQTDRIDGCETGTQGQSLPGEFT